jgi:carboxypeptidase Taq
LGNLTASQLWQAANRDLPSLSSSIDNRDYQPLLRWLREKVHAHGRRYPASELVERATGRALDTEAHLSVLESKVKELGS